MSGTATVPLAQQIQMGQELVASVHTVLTTPVRVRHFEILRLRAWLRLALLETNRKAEDGVQGFEA